MANLSSIISNARPSNNDDFKTGNNPALRAVEDGYITEKYMQREISLGKEDGLAKMIGRNEMEIGNDKITRLLQQQFSVGENAAIEVVKRFDTAINDALDQALGTVQQVS